VVPFFLIPSLNLGESPSVWLHSAQRSGLGTSQSVSVSHPGRISSEGTSNYVSYGLSGILFRLFWLYWLCWLLELAEAVPPFLLFISFIFRIFFLGCSGPWEDMPWAHFFGFQKFLPFSGVKKG
jgi:hypothetical protein